MRQQSLSFSPQDGTLTVPNLDFKAMYERSCVAMDEDILVAMTKMTEQRRGEVASIIEEMEEEGRRTLQLMTGARDIAQWLARHGIKTALVTRNSRRTVTHLASTLWSGLPPFDPVISRDDPYPPKPQPDAMFAIIDAWCCLPEQIVMCGDSPTNDIVFGRRAGAWTALLDTGSGTCHMDRESTPDFVMDSLLELPRLLWQHFEIDSPLGTSAPLQKYPAPVPTHPACVAAAKGDASVALSDNLEVRDVQTPLLWAADAGHLHAVRALIQGGADINARGYLGATAVSRAARNGDVDVLAELLAAPSCACIDDPNDKMQTPLHFAAFNLHRPAIQLLLSAGASTTVLDRKGRTAAEDTSSTEIRNAILHARNAWRDRHNQGDM